MNPTMSSLCLAILLLLSGCAGNSVLHDYTHYKNHLPKSIIVITPENQSPDINAAPSLLTQINYPLAEAGYYVFPIAVVEETFRQNGVTNAHDIRTINPKKIQEIFGADALLDLQIKDYGTQFQLIDSVTRVTAAAKLIDLKTGAVLWSGSATANSNEQDNSVDLNPISMLVKAVVKQVMASSTNKSHQIAGITACRLLAVGGKNGLLYGPRSPLFKQDQQ